MYFFCMLDELAKHFSTREQERVKSPWREFYSQKTSALLKTHCSTYQLMARACAGFSHLLIYILNMYRPTEPFLFLLIGVLKYSFIKEP